MATNINNQVATQSTQLAKAGGSDEIKSFPTVPQLATPTDLKPEAVQTVTEAVNTLIADAFALYVKTKNYHWHLASSHFRDYHLLFDEQADAIFESIDTMAERIRRIGGTTIRSIAHISQLQTIADDHNEYVPIEQMVQRLIEDNRHIAKRQRAAIELCDEHRDVATGNVLEEILDQTEKRLWFLFEVSQGGHNMD